MSQSLLPPIGTNPPRPTKDQAKLSGYTGDQCATCYGMRMRRNGSCLMCEECGTTTGCS